MATMNPASQRAKARVVVFPASSRPDVSGGVVSTEKSLRHQRQHVGIENYLYISDSNTTMPPSRAITNDTRLIDLNLGELLDVLVERLHQTLPIGSNQTPPEALLDTWGAAQLLGIAPKHDPGPEPIRGTPAWKTWRDHSQAVRDDIAHRFQQLLARRPELARLARYEGRRRYFVRADVVRYLDQLGDQTRLKRR